MVYCSLGRAGQVGGGAHNKKERGPGVGPRCGQRKRTPEETRVLEYLRLVFAVFVTIDKLFDTSIRIEKL